MEAKNLVLLITISTLMIIISPAAAAAPRRALLQDSLSLVPIYENTIKGICSHTNDTQYCNTFVTKALGNQPSTPIKVFLSCVNATIEATEADLKGGPCPQLRQSALDSLKCAAEGFSRVGLDRAVSYAQWDLNAALKVTAECRDKLPPTASPAAKQTAASLYQMTSMSLQIANTANLYWA